jgi:hypothetical protein
LRFSQRWLWRVSSSGIWRRVIRWVAPDVSEERIALLRAQHSNAVPRHLILLGCTFQGTHSDLVFLLVLWFSPWVLTVSFYLRTNQQELGLTLCSLYIPIFRLASILLATCLFDCLLNYSSDLKMEARYSSETSGATQRTTRRHIPENDTLQITSRLCNTFLVTQLASKPAEHKHVDRDDDVY